MEVSRLFASGTSFVDLVFTELPGRWKPQIETLVCRAAVDSTQDQPVFESTNPCCFMQLS
jgi:hypothetical protein